jgi:SAM-dependent methyltransferase
VPSIFRQQHAILKNVLPTGSDVQTLEVGCFPGGFLEYFHRELGHSVTGLEYVKDSCKQCRKILEDRHVPSTILHGDLFKDDWNTDQSVWDVVFSAGLIEHFDDSSPAIERHLQLVAPGGHCVITLPNHSGLLGLIMKTVNRRMWEVHNRMCGEQVLDAFNRAPSSDRFELTCCRYAEHAGLWNCGVYDRLRAFGRPAFVVGRASGLIAERALRWVPNTKLMSPNIILVAKARF